MYYSQTRVIMGGLAHVPILIFIVNLIKGKFAAIAEDINVFEANSKGLKVKVVDIKKEEIKAEEVKESEVDETEE